MDKTLKQFIQKDSYLKEWRNRTAVQLSAVGLPDHLILASFCTNRRTDLVVIAKTSKIDPKTLFKILGV